MHFLFAKQILLIVEFIIMSYQKYICNKKRRPKTPSFFGSYELKKYF
ncbi:hypothetical protein HMPREF3189_00936 [Clostridiales bacterium KA00134]|nr:hypothetical protein HMPREF3189_00936 [Clostridiales bacterium KA00134]